MEEVDFDNAFCFAMLCSRNAALCTNGAGLNSCPSRSIKLDQVAAARSAHAARADGRSASEGARHVQEASRRLHRRIAGAATDLDDPRRRGAGAAARVERGLGGGVLAPVHDLPEARARRTPTNHEAQAAARGLLAKLEDVLIDLVSEVRIDRGRRVSSGTPVSRRRA